MINRFAVDCLQRQEQRHRIGESQAGDRDDQADRSGDLHDAPKKAVPQELHEDLERPPFLVDASAQHEEDGIGVEDDEIENERRRKEAARRQSYCGGAQGESSNLRFSIALPSGPGMTAAAQSLSAIQRSRQRSFDIIGRLARQLHRSLILITKPGEQTNIPTKVGSHRG